MHYENERVEFKETYVDEIYKEVIAFANTDGGSIFVGVNDSGDPIGLEHVDDTYTRITNGIRDVILPDVTMFVKYFLEKNQTIRIQIGEGSCKPYYLKSKGLKPSGVYVRQGASSAPASPEQIRQMIKNADGDVFETLRSLEQNLAFDYTANLFSKYDTDFGQDKYYALGVKNSDFKLYTNLGLLLSDQCPYTIKIAVFSDEKNTVFRDRKEFTGSVFKQLEEAFNYLQLSNQNKSIIDGLARQDYWDYPKEALREALLNAIIHRDYNYSGSIIININSHCIEFISIGGLFSGITPDDIRNGISLSRNGKLASVFHRLHFIESYGTGIRRIYALYEDCMNQPLITVTQNSFKITLPNMNTSSIRAVPLTRVSSAVTPQMEILLAYLTKYGEISDREVQNLLDIKRTRAYTLTRQMKEIGLIKSSGRGSGKKYIASDMKLS